MKSAGLARGLAATHELVQHDLRHEALSDLWCITTGTVEGKRYTICERRRLAHGKPVPYPCKTCSVDERAFYVCRVNLPSPVWVAAASVGLAMGFHDTAGLLRCPVLMMQDKSIPKAVLTHGISPFAYGVQVTDLSHQAHHHDSPLSSHNGAVNLRIPNKDDGNEPGGGLVD